MTDGLLTRVAQRTVKFVDGDENGYDYDTAHGDFWRAAVEQKTMLPEVLDAQSRMRYRALHSTSFGVYVDNYVNDATEHHYIPPLDGSRLRRFVQNLNQATEAADEYVWFWNEGDCWVRWNKDKKLPKRTRARVYEEIMPGFTKALSFLRERGKLPKDLPANLVAPGGVGHWSDGKVKGTFTREGGDYVAAGVELGGYSARIADVRPGDIYGVRFCSKGVRTCAGISWKSNGEWRKSGIAVPCGPADASGWCTGEAVFVVPPGMDTLVLALCVKDQKPHDAARFRDISVYRLGVD